jgi:predicted DNA-binding protein
MTIRLPKELYERLRLAAFEDRTSQAAIITEGVELRLAERDRARREASTAS